MQGDTRLLEKNPASAPRGARTRDAAPAARVSAPAAVQASPVARGGVANVQAMQRTVGNQAVMRWLNVQRPRPAAPAVQARHDDEDEVQRAAAIEPRAVQRTIWEGWESRLGDVTPETRDLAKLGMAIVDWLREVGIDARIGGSLSAAMFGGRRQPRDIDIDVPVESPSQASSSEGQTNVDIIRKRLMRLHDALLTLGNDVFYLKSVDKTSAGHPIEYVAGRTEAPIDPYDDEEVDAVKRRLEDEPTARATVDVSSEAIFPASKLKVDDQGAAQGYYGPEFLISAYLNRLVGNLARGTEDEKNDRDQISSLLERMLATEIDRSAGAGQPLDVAGMRAFLTAKMQSVMDRYVAEDHRMKADAELRGNAEQLIREIVVGAADKFAV